MGATEVLRLATPFFNDAFFFFGQMISIHEYTASIGDENDNHVRGTSGEGLFSLTGRWVSQNSPDNVHIRQNH